LKGEPALVHEEKHRTWPLIEPKPGDSYPPLSELISRWSKVMDGVVQSFEAQPEDAISRVPSEGKESLAETCLRVINHLNSHLRSIWCILGERRVDEKWPEQQTWLA
jgi:hypothetical protein